MNLIACTIFSDRALAPEPIECFVSNSKMETYSAISIFYNKLINIHRHLLAGTVTADHATDFIEHIHILREHMKRYDKQGQVLHNPKIYLNKVQYEHYLKLENKEYLNRLLGAVVPSDHRKLIHLLQINGFPMDLTDEEASLYFALDDGLKSFNARMSQMFALCL